MSLLAGSSMKSAFTYKEFILLEPFPKLLSVAEHPLASDQLQAELSSMSAQLKNRVGELSAVVDTASSAEEIAFLSTSVCEATREISFVIDLLASLCGYKSIETEQIKTDVLTELMRGRSLIEDAAKILSEKDIPNDSLRLARYAKSTQARIERLAELNAKGIQANHRRFLSDNYVVETDYDPTVNLSSNPDGFVFSAIQWHIHRLGWMLTELKLESGPYAAACEQHLRLAEKAQKFSELLCELVIRTRDQWEATSNLETLLHAFFQAVDFWPFLIGLTNQQLEAFRATGDSVSETDARIFIEDVLVRETRDFVAFLNSELDRYIASEADGINELREIVDADKSSAGRMASPGNPNVGSTFTRISETEAIRVLLMMEDQAPKKWTACGLDLAIIAFGDNPDEAVTEFIEQINEFQEVPRRLKKAAPQLEAAFADGQILSDIRPGLLAKKKN
jgi:hypothetical protein